MVVWLARKQCIRTYVWALACDIVTYCYNRQTHSCPISQPFMSILHVNLCTYIWYTSSCRKCCHTNLHTYVRMYICACLHSTYVHMPSLYVCVYTYVFPIVCQTFVSHSVVTHCFYSLCFTDLSNAEGTMFLEKSRSYTKLLGGMFHSSIQVFTVSI